MVYNFNQLILSILFSKLLFISKLPPLLFNKLKIKNIINFINHILI